MPGAAALRARGVRIDLEAKEPFTTTEVLQAVKDVPLAELIGALAQGRIDALLTRMFSLMEKASLPGCARARPVLASRLHGL